MEEKKCNCNEPYDAEYFQGGYPYCPVHDKPKESNMAIIGHGEPKHHPGSSYQNLFDYLTKEHGLTLLQGEMDDLISMVYKFHPVGAVWVKASTRTSTQGKQVYAKDESGRKTVGYFTKSNLASDVIDTFYSMVGGFYIKGKDYESLEWLDESPAAAREEDWISVEDRLPEIGEYVMVYNTERATLIGRLMNNGWAAMFADGEQFMGS